MQDGRDLVGRREGADVDRQAGGVVGRPQSLVLAVPNGELTREIAESRHRLEFEALDLRLPAQADEGGDDVRVQIRPAIQHPRDVGARATGQFRRIQVGDASRELEYSMT